MKTTLLALALTFILPMGAFAGTFDFTPNGASMEPGGATTVEVYVVPDNGETIYTAELHADFSAEILTASSWSFASNWLQVAQPDYDELDNGTGELIKTAGYPGGIDDRTLLGTLIVTGASAGEATITVNEDSMLYDAESDNLFESSTDNVMVITVASTPAPTPAPTTTGGGTTADTAPEADEEVVDEDLSPELDNETEAEDLTPTTSQAAAAGAAGFGFGDMWPILLAILILLIIAGGGYYYMSRNKTDETTTPTM